jgi:hypothetical protein
MRPKPSSLIGRLNSTCLLELVDGRVDVVAHEIELVMTSLLRWVCCQFGRWQGEDEPAVPQAVVDFEHFMRVTGTSIDDQHRPTSTQARPSAEEANPVRVLDGRWSRGSL